MSRSKAGGWIAGTVAIALVMALAAYFLLISPTLASAQETREAAQSQVDQNTITRKKVAALEKQFANIDALKAELSTLQLQVPTTEDMANFRRQLDATAVAHSVTVTSLSVSSPAAITPPAAAPAAEPAPVEAATTDPNAAPAPAPAPVAIGYSIPVSMDVVGTYENVLAFLQDLQVAQQRLFNVGSISGSSPGEAEAGNGRPALPLGSLDLQIGGNVFVLPPLTPVEAPTTAADGTPLPPAQLPPANGRNPLVP